MPNKWSAFDSIKCTFYSYWYLNLNIVHIIRVEQVKINGWRQRSVNINRVDRIFYIPIPTWNFRTRKSNSLWKKNVFSVLATIYLASFNILWNTYNFLLFNIYRSFSFSFLRFCQKQQRRNCLNKMQLSTKPKNWNIFMRFIALNDLYTAKSCFKTLDGNQIDCNE